MKRALLLLLLAACGTDSADAPTGPPAAPPPTSTAADPPLPPPAAGDAIAIYPAPPLAHPSKDFRVKVGGKAVYVEHYGDVSYARFAFKGAIDVDIETEKAIAAHRTLPALAATKSGSSLRVSLPAPANAVVWIDDREKLFLLADPIEENTPVVGQPGVIAVQPTAGLATTAIQAAIDQGGTVYLGPGRWLTGTLSLKSNVTLYLAPGAVLQGAFDPGEYPIDPGKKESGTDTSLAADPRFFGRTMTFSRLLLVDQATNVRIKGRGTIDGDGSFLRMQHNAVPNLIRVRSSENVVIEDVLVRNAAAWTVHLLASKNLRVQNLKLLNDRANLNTDGIDPDMSQDVVIDRAFIYTKDDAICLKATRNGELTGDVKNVRVTNSIVSSLDAGLKLGTESIAGAFQNVSFEDSIVFESGRALSIVVRDGATYDGVSFKRITIDRNVDHLVEQVIGVRAPEAALGVIKNLTFEDVTATSFTKPASNWTWYAQFRPTKPQQGATNVPVFEGADDAHAVDGLRFKNVVVNGKHLSSADVAKSEANLTLGPFVKGVSFE